jgi:hypothetical protein
MVNVPKLPELTAQSLTANCVRDKLLSKYLPDLADTDGRIKTINRQYLFNMINTLRPEFFP